MSYQDIKGRVAENNNCTNNAEMYATIIAQIRQENERHAKSIDELLKKIK
jgi:hypothetical protein